MKGSGDATMLTAGIDVGSSSAKIVIVRHVGDRAEICAAQTERIRRRDLRLVIGECYERAIEECGASKDDLRYIATTGEGELVEFRRGHFFGMTTHARGALFLDPEARAALDVGALHARAIRMDERARVLGHRMTSQCASGSGQFLENIARYLGVALEEVGPLSTQGKDPEIVSSICAVLAETDVINMVLAGNRCEGHPEGDSSLDGGALRETPGGGRSAGRRGRHGRARLRHRAPGLHARGGRATEGPRRSSRSRGRDLCRSDRGRSLGGVQAEAHRGSGELPDAGGMIPLEWQTRDNRADRAAAGGETATARTVPAGKDSI